MILKPYRLSPDNTAQDATNDIVVSWANQGDRQYSYQVDIYNISDNTLAQTSSKMLSIDTFYLIPKNILINGNTYKYQVTVWNQNNESATSDWIIFKCSSVPVVTFSNLMPNAEILNSSYTFQGQYSQAENISIMSWQMILYDNTENVIGDTNIVFSNAVEHSFAGLNSERLYSVEAIVTSQNGLSSSTGKVPFSVKYETPPLTIALEAENNKDDASVKLLWNILQIIGESENSTYINNEKIDVTQGKVWFDDGFDIEGNFTLKLWIEGVENKVITTYPESSIVACATSPVDISSIWLEDINQVDEILIDAIVKSNSPEGIKSLWIEDQTQLDKRHLTSNSIEIITPSYLNTLWVDVFPSSEIDMLEILKMKNSKNDSISLIYCNNTFYLFKNDLYQGSIGVSSLNYYLYIQQVGNNLYLHAEEN